MKPTPEKTAEKTRPAAERKERFATLGNIPLKTVYTQEDLAGDNPAETIGAPGEFPYTRGIYPTMYRGRLWTMRQYAGFGTARQSNERFRYLLGKGQTGLSVAFDLPTQIGMDSDSPRSAGEVGKTGVAIDSLEDMEVLFNDIPLDRVSTSMTINATAAILLALYAAVAKKQGADLRKLSGTVQNDILKEFIARGTYIYPPRPSMRIVTDLFAWCRAELPAWNMISISGYHIREAGSTAAQEIAFTLADAIAYVDAAVAAGLAVDEFAPRLSFFFNAHNDLLEEIAKYRAARRLWAHIMRERFGARDPDSMKLRFHVQTAGSSLTAQQPENNIVRVAIQALGAVLGGCQSLHTNAMDEALALPTEDAALLALRTQQIIAHETGVANTVDPVGGSYAIEKLTDEVEARAKEYDRPNRCAGRDAARDRNRLRAGRNSEGRVRLPARGREPRTDCGGRQSVRRGKGNADTDHARRSGDGARASGARAGAARAPGRAARRRRGGRSRTPRPLRREPYACDCDGGRIPGDRRRDFRCVAARVRRIHGVGGSVVQWRML